MADNFSYFLAGLQANACIYAKSVAATNEDSDFPASNLQNGLPWYPFKGSAATTDFDVQFDMNQMLNGGFEDNADGEDPDEWTINGAVQVSSTQQSEGSVSLRLNADGQYAYQDRKVIAGKTYRLECDLRTSANTIRVYLLDLQTGNWWNGATWSATKDHIFTSTSATFEAQTDRFDIETQATGRGGYTTVRVQVEKVGAGTAYADYFRLYPYIDFFSLHDFNQHDQIAVKLESSTSGAYGGEEELEATLNASTVVGNNAYVKFDPQNPAPRQYWRILFDGDLYLPLRIGQTALGHANVMTRPTDQDYAVKAVMPQTGYTEGPGAQPISLLDRAPRMLQLKFGSSATALAQVLYDFIENSGHGSEPVVIVPDSSRPEELIHGRVAADWQYKRGRGSEFFEYPVEIFEDAFIKRIT